MEFKRLASGTYTSEDHVWFVQKSLIKEDTWYVGLKGSIDTNDRRMRLFSNMSFNTMKLAKAFVETVVEGVPGLELIKLPESFQIAYKEVYEAYGAYKDELEGEDEGLPERHVFDGDLVFCPDSGEKEPVDYGVDHNGDLDGTVRCDYCSEIVQGV